MREIKYRGKHISTGEWVYGTPVKELRTYAWYIVEWYDGVNGDLQRHIVDPKTVGQWTGVKYNGQELYEDDIVEIEYHPEMIRGDSIANIINPWNEDRTKAVITCQCSWGSNDTSYHLIRIDDKSYGCYAVQFGGSAVKSKKITGNIHDTPDK